MLIVSTSRRPNSSSFSLSKILNKIHQTPFSTFFYSGKPLQKETNYHLYGHEPLAFLFEDALFDYSKQNWYQIDDIYDFVSQFLSKNKNNFEANLNDLDDNITSHFPFTGGLMGYFSFEYKNILEEKKIFKKKKTIVPDCVLVLYKTIEVHPITKNKKGIIVEQDIKENNLSLVSEDKEKKLNKKYSFLFSNHDTLPRTIKNFFTQYPNKERKAFEKNVTKIKNHIRKGDVYQVNLSYDQIGKISLEKSLNIFENLLTQNPAPYQGVFKLHNHLLVSTSPERLFLYDRGKIIASPIKGSIPRSKNQKKDEANKQKLLNSKKDLAELAMIVDLLRNDLHKVNSKKIDTNTKIEICDFPALLTYENVYHLCSHITTQTTTDDTNAFDVLRSLFPGGSISGCPKIKSCQIIDKLEKKIRGFYTGSMGYFSFNDRAEFNILIRSVHFYRYKNYFLYSYRLGGGITLLSDEREEYKETIAKGKTIKESIKNSSKTSV